MMWNNTWVTPFLRSLVKMDSAETNCQMGAQGLRRLNISSQSLDNSLLAASIHFTHPTRT